MNVLKQSKEANEINSPLDGASFKRLLVPVYFSVCALETLRYAKGLAENFDAVIDVLHVVHASVSRDEAAIRWLAGPARSAPLARRPNRRKPDENYANLLK
jgi:hypothetical protein